MIPINFPMIKIKKYYDSNYILLGFELGWHEKILHFQASV